MENFYPEETIGEEKALRKHVAEFKTQGFDSEYETFPRYILGITHRIWEERQIETINRYYHSNIELITNDVVLNSNENVVGDTIAMLHMFPNRQLLGDDVIWKETVKGEYFSSHRILSTMNHFGDGALGKATGKEVFTYAFADCYVKENRIFKEWLVRDWLGVLKQLGVNYEEFAHSMAERAWASYMLKSSSTRIAPSGLSHAKKAKATTKKGLVSGSVAKAFSAASPNIGIVPPQDVQVAITNSIDAFKAAWEEGAFAGFASCCQPAVRVVLPGAKTAHGREQLNQYLFSIIGGLSEVRFSLDSFAATSMPGFPVRVALRYQIAARNVRVAGLGEPCGELLHFFSVLHCEFYAKQIKNAWLGIDEISLRKQIYLNKFASASPMVNDGMETK